MTWDTEDNCFSPEWILICNCKLPDWANDFVHSEQLKGFSSVWTLDAPASHLTGQTTFYSWSSWKVSHQCALLNDSADYLHGQMTFYTESSWRVFQQCELWFKLLEVTNDLRHWEQLWGFSPVWTLKCLSNTLERANDFIQQGWRVCFRKVSYQLLSNLSSIPGSSWVSISSMLGISFPTTSVIGSGNLSTLAPFIPAFSLSLNLKQKKGYKLHFLENKLLWYNFQGWWFTRLQV